MEPILVEVEVFIDVILRDLENKSFHNYRLDLMDLRLCWLGGWLVSW